MGLFDKFFGNKKDAVPSKSQTVPEKYTLEEAQQVEKYGQRLVDIINESLHIVNDSQDYDTKASRLDLAEQKLISLKDLCAQYSFLSLQDLEAVENTISELKQDTCKFSEYVNIVSLGKSLEDEGRIGEAIEAYENLVRQKIAYPLPYRRLAILYRKTKSDTNELRILDEALKNLPEAKMGNHYTWFQDRLNKKTKKEL